MPLMISDLPVPLRADHDGVVRVGDSRVTLDSVVTAYMQGATAEQIADDFPALDLADIHAVIGFYQGHVEEVESYLREQRRIADQVRQETEATVPPSSIRQRLLARRGRKDQGDAPSRSG
jgi:uncharacterized protein (DUF433 family)